MDTLSTARQFVLEHPWAVIAVVVVAIVLVRGLTARMRLRTDSARGYDGPPRDASAVRDPRPIVRKARRQMIMVLIALAVVAILVIMQNLQRAGP